MATESNIYQNFIKGQVKPPVQLLPSQNIVINKFKFC